MTLHLATGIGCETCCSESAAMHLLLRLQATCNRVVLVLSTKVPAPCWEAKVSHKEAEHAYNTAAHYVCHTLHQLQLTTYKHARAGLPAAGASAALKHRGPLLRKRGQRLPPVGAAEQAAVVRALGGQPGRERHVRALVHRRLGRRLRERRARTRLAQQLGRRLRPQPGALPSSILRPRLT